MASNKHICDSASPIAAIYARYSSHAQNDASIEQQIEVCKEYAANKGIKIASVYADRAVSGRSDRRPEFQKMMRHAEKGEFQIVIAYKSNRIARNMLHALAYEEKLSRSGVSVVYVKEEFGDNAAGRFALRTMMNLNQFFSENLSEDVTRGMLDNAQQCRVNGALPYGYKKGSDGAFEIDTEKAAIVREIFERIANGEIQASIADDLNKRRILTGAGKPWGKNSFHNILNNERYTGVYIYSDVRIVGGVPKIIDRDLFDRAQRRVEAMKTIVKARRRRPDVSYLLTGKLFCGHCETAMVGTSGTSKTGEMYYYYRCNNQAVSKTCTKRPVRKEWIETLVVSALHEYVFRPDVIDWIADMVMKYKRVAEENSDLKYLERRLQESKTATQNILKAIEAGVFSTAVNERLKELEGEQSELEAQILAEKRIVPDVTREQIVFWLKKFKDGEISDISYQKKLIQHFLRSVYLYDDHLKIIFDFSEDGSSVDFPLPSISDEPAESVRIDPAGVYQEKPFISQKERWTVLLFYMRLCLIFWVLCQKLGSLSKVGVRAER